MLVFRKVLVFTWSGGVLPRLCFLLLQKNPQTSSLVLTPNVLANMAPLFSKRLSCFYCGRRSVQPNKGLVRKWRCKHCEAVNYLDEVRHFASPRFPATRLTKQLLLEWRNHRSSYCRDESQSLYPRPLKPWLRIRRLHVVRLWPVLCSVSPQSTSIYQCFGVVSPVFGRSKLQGL
jgi:hypothetical protein